MIIYQNTLLQFINNTALTKGGAIYHINSGQKDFLSTQRCLLYYYDLQDQDLGSALWTSKFIFSGNSAPYGRSIYCTTLLTCIWNNIPENMTIGGGDITQVFNWSNIFYYKDHQPDKIAEEIATDTVNINFNTNRHTKIPPGQFYRFNIKPVDDRGQPSHPAIIAYTNDSGNSQVDFITTKSHYYVILYGRIDSNISLTLYTVNNQAYFTTIMVTIDKCPPGFRQSNQTSSE